MKGSKGGPRFQVSADGKGVVSRAGTALLRELADESGLVAAWTAAVIDTYKGLPVHEPGRVLTDLAVAIADGGSALSDLRTLRDQDKLFGAVASDATAWRVLDRVDAERLGRLRAGRAAARAAVWAAGGGPDLTAGLRLFFDASLLDAHAEKEDAAPTWKKGFGFHPLLCYLDRPDVAGAEALAGLLRPGNAGSNTAVDHIEVLTEAIAQIPARYRRDLLVTVDGAGATLDLIRHITGLNTVHGRRVHYSVGFDLDQRARTAIGEIAESDWQHVWDRDGEPRDLDDAGVVELTGLLRTSVGGDELANWPADMRIVCRRERPGSGAQLCALEETDGWRYQLFATNTPGRQLAFLEARHRVHARVEDRIRCGKATGLDHLPSTNLQINTAWCIAATIAADLLCWLRLLCLDRSLADAEPKTLRYRVLHTAVRIVRGQRKRKIKIPQTWPWARELEAAFQAAFTLAPT